MGPGSRQSASKTRANALQARPGRRGCGLHSPYSLPLVITSVDPEARRVVLRNVKLTAQLNNQAAIFTLTAIARVKDPKGGSLSLLSGAVALAAAQSYQAPLPPGSPVIAIASGGNTTLHFMHSLQTRIQTEK